MCVVGIGFRAEDSSSGMQPNPGDPGAAIWGSCHPSNHAGPCVQKSDMNVAVVTHFGGCACMHSAIFSNLIKLRSDSRISPQFLIAPCLVTLLPDTFSILEAECNIYLGL